MRVVITGATGLIGKELMKLVGSDAVGLTRGNPTGQLVHTDYSDLAERFQDADTVVHLAAIRGKGSDYQHFMDNAVLTEDVLKAAVEAGVQKVIFMSSIATYSDLSLLPWNETQPQSPQSFYALSKITGEHLCELYSRKGLSYIIFRCGIVLGRGKDRRMADIFIDKASNKDTLTVNGKSIAKRDFIYVKDVAQALKWAVYGNIENQVYNLGSGHAYTNLELAEMINHVFGNEGNLIYKDDEPEGIADSYMDSGKLFKAGWHPQYSLIGALDDMKEEMEKQKHV